MDTAFFGEFQGIADQVHNDLAQPDRVTMHEAAQCGYDFYFKIETLFPRIQFQQAGGCLDRPSQIEVAELQFQPSGFQFRDVEDVVNHPQQRTCGIAHGFGTFQLLAVEIAPQQDFAHAYDAIHRRADFVRHVCQKLGLGSIRQFRLRSGRLRLIPCRFRSAFGDLALRDIGIHAHDPAVRQRRAADFKDRAVRPLSLVDMRRIRDPAGPN